jgi:hypothetical protein
MLNEEPTEAGYGKAGKQKPLSNFPTASTTTKYIQLWDTDSEGKATEFPPRKLNGVNVVPVIPPEPS